MTGGSSIAGYTLVRILGRGSRAVVWEAVHESSGRRVALKVLDTLAGGAAERLQAEFEAQGALDHPNIVRVEDLIEIEGKLTLVAELVPGPDLREFIDQRKPGKQEALRIYGGILRGLAAAHELGFVHRDLKPQNILLTPTSRPVAKISDFGIVKTTHDLGLTTQGMVLGTLRYMPPEQLQDPSSVDARADVFSAGCILFEVLTHQRCFDAPNKVALMNVVRMGQHTPFPEGFDPEIRALILRMIDPDLENRPASANEVLEQLDLPSDPNTDLITLALPVEEPESRPTALLGAIAVAVLLVVAAIAYALLG